MNDSLLRVLVIEDSPGDAGLIREMLEAGGEKEFRMDHRATLAEGLKLARLTSPGQGFGIALLDLGLPDSIGLETFREFRRAQPNLPVVVLSGSTDDSMAIAAVREGAQDFVPKGGLSPALLRRTLRHALERHGLSEQATYLARHDQLTGAYNRHSFDEWIQEEMERARRYDHPLGFLMLDVNDFKSINDTCGHSIGDQVLVSIAKELEAQLRNVDRVFRFGGDEFLVVLPETDDAADIVATHLEEALSMPIETGSETLHHLTVSIGAATWTPGSDESVEQIVSKADARMYEDKRACATGEESWTGDTP